jgi:hypothetical protein
VDDRYAYGERRVYAIGLMNGLEITVVYTGSAARRLAHHFRRGARSRINAGTTGTTSRAKAIEA